MADLTAVQKVGSYDDPAQLWEAVCKTCPASKTIDHTTVNRRKGRKGWHTIRIFVSSTFKDFHCEREVLIKEVL